MYEVFYQADLQPRSLHTIFDESIDFNIQKKSDAYAGYDVVI